MTTLKALIQIGSLVLVAIVVAGCKIDAGTQGDSQNAAAEQSPEHPVPANNENMPPQNAEIVAQKEDQEDETELPRYTSSPEPPLPISSKGLTREVIKNVDIHPDDLLVYRIRTIRGTLLRRYKSSPPMFDDKRSFILNIESGVIGLKMDTLSNLMNNYVFAYTGAPLKDFQFSVEGNEIKATGKVHKLVDLPFEVKGELSATPDGKIRIHPTSVKAEGLPIKGFLHLFGIELDDVIKAREARGLKFDGDDLIVDPERGGPPPMIRGKVTAVQIVGDEVIVIFGGSRNLSAPQIARLAKSHSGGNYVSFRGGVLRFGKMTMTNSDIQVVDANAKDPLDFSVDHFNRQMIAGYSKITPHGGLVAHVPDYYRVRRAGPPHGSHSRKAGL